MKVNVDNQCSKKLKSQVEKVLKIMLHENGWNLKEA